MNSNHIEIQQLLKNYHDTKSMSTEITESLQEINNLKDGIKKKEYRIAEIRNYVNSLDKKIIQYEDSIKKIHASEDYQKFTSILQNHNKQEKTNYCHIPTLPDGLWFSRSLRILYGRKIVKKML